MTMKKMLLSIICCLVLIPANVKAQDTLQISVSADKFSVGLGGGLDYGGFGANLLICPAKNIGLFAGAGYAFAGLGFNGGIKLRIVPSAPNKKVSPYFLAMYGYNAAIAVSGASEYNKMFYGATIGAGIDLRARPESRGYWSVALLLPFRSPDVSDYMDELTNSHGVEFKNDLLPVGFSIGYRFIIN